MGRGDARAYARRAVILVVLTAGLLSACQAAPEEEATREEPARVETVSGGLTKVTLLAKAAERLGIQTARVREGSLGGVKRKVADYGALIYDADGNAFVYTNPEPLVFVRAKITVLSIQDSRVFFTGGPTTGTSIVTVGVPELFGIDSGVGGNE